MGGGGELAERGQGEGPWWHQVGESVGRMGVPLGFFSRLEAVLPSHSWQDRESWPPGWSSSSIWLYSSVVTVENYRPLRGREGIHTVFSTRAEAPGGNLATLGSLVTDKRGSTQGGIYEFQLYPKGRKEGVLHWEGGLATWPKMGNGTWWKEKINSPK